MAGAGGGRTRTLYVHAAHCCPQTASLDRALIHGSHHLEPDTITEAGSAALPVTLHEGESALITAKDDRPDLSVMPVCPNGDAPRPSTPDLTCQAIFIG